MTQPNLSVEEIIEQSRHLPHPNYALQIILQKYDKLMLDIDAMNGMPTESQRHKLMDLQFCFRMMYYNCPLLYRGLK